MIPKINYQVNPKENLYFSFRILASIALYILLIYLTINLFSSYDAKKAPLLTMFTYAIIISVYLFFRLGLLIGYLKGNAIRVNENQFSDINNIVKNQSIQLGISKYPDVFILQSGGILNAFASRFLGRNYIVLYSEIVEAAYEQDNNILEFIIAHELGHIKRKHMTKNLLLFPSLAIPFLGSAYSRACEYTCDNIGFALAPNGLKSGILLLASGRTIYKNVNVDEYLKQGKSYEGFWKWFAEKVSSHPHLSKRLLKFEHEQVFKTTNTNPQRKEYKTVDHSKFMPI